MTEATFLSQGVLIRDKVLGFGGVQVFFSCFLWFFVRVFHGLGFRV